MKEFKKVLDRLTVQLDDNLEQCLASVQPLANILKMPFENPNESDFHEAVIPSWRESTKIFPLYSGSLNSLWPCF